MVNEKTVRFRIQPYIQEAILQLTLDLLIMGLTVTVLILVEMPSYVWAIVVACYLAIASVAHYRVAVLALADKKNADYVTETVKIERFSEEYSFAGDRLGHSNIRFFYPKDIQVRKYKVKATGDGGEERKLRAVMSFRRLLQFSILDNYHTEYIQVTYLKRSRILLWVELTEPTPQNTNRRENQRKAKTIRSINTLV